MRETKEHVHTGGAMTDRRNAAVGVKQAANRLGIRLAVEREETRAQRCTIPLVPGTHQVHGPRWVPTSRR